LLCSPPPGEGADDDVDADADEVIDENRLTKNGFIEQKSFLLIGF
jgi:hypothetical protein